MCDANDPMVRKLAQRAVRKVSDDPAERAEAIRGFVHSYIRDKNLDTGFGTASEVARRREGDCSEHGVLTCAQCFAPTGIPARVATGLVYADTFAGERSIFGWHMWTQALIDGTWVDYDATLPVRYDAAHILTNTSRAERNERRRRLLQRDAADGESRGDGGVDRVGTAGRFSAMRGRMLLTSSASF